MRTIVTRHPFLLYVGRIFCKPPPVYKTHKKGHCRLINKRIFVHWIQVFSTIEKESDETEINTPNNEKCSPFYIIWAQ